MTIRTDMIRELADFILEPVPSTHFDFNHWVGKNWQGKPDLSCGTNACGLGWATVKFPHLLRLVKERGAHMAWVQYIGDNPAVITTYQDYTPVSISLAAAMSAFGLTYRQARYLFLPETPLPYNGELPISPYGDATAQEVSEHFRRFADWADRQK